MSWTVHLPDDAVPAAPPVPDLKETVMPDIDADREPSTPALQEDLRRRFFSDADRPHLGPALATELERIAGALERIAELIVNDLEDALEAAVDDASDDR